MNFSASIFLINKDVRMVRVQYDPAESPKAQKYDFKTLDPNIAVDDIVIVPTTTRWQFTCAKVVEVDVDVELESSHVEYKWLAGKVDVNAQEALIKQEALAVARIRSAETTRKRAELAKSLQMDPSAFEGIDIATSAPVLAPPAPPKEA